MKYIEYEYCVNCGRDAIDQHHCVFKSKVPALRKCKHNLVYLCRECHYEIHHKSGKLDLKMKLRFQNYLESQWLKNSLTYDEIKETLDITDSNMRRLLKTCITDKEGKYKREDVIRTCMGGKLYKK